MTQRGCPYEHGELGDAGRSGGSLVRDGSGDGIWSMASVSSVLGCFLWGRHSSGWVIAILSDLHGGWWSGGGELKMG